MDGRKGESKPTTMPSSTKFFEWRPEDCEEDYSVQDGAELPKSYAALRKELPARCKCKGLRITSIVKHIIGKDLTQVSLPLSVNEPLSMLQRLAEGLEFAYLLDKADTAEDAILRIELVTAFCIACLSTGKDRTLKPFNPVLGETYQLETNGARLIAEQVSHHPPLSAVYAEDNHFKIWMNVEPEVYFWGMSLEINSKGTTVVHLKRVDEYYYWTTVPVHVKNIVMGTPYLEYIGTLTVRKKSSNLLVAVEFAGKSRQGVEGTAVKGHVLDNGHKVRIMRGYWADHLMSAPYGESRLSSASVGSSFVTPPPSAGRLKSGHERHRSLKRKSNRKMSADQRLSASSNSKASHRSNQNTQRCAPGDSANTRMLFKMREKPTESSEYYNFGYFTMLLNQIRPGDETGLCSTDSRFRPDLRAWENGQEEKAEMLRERIRGIQRRLNETGDVAELPRWFVRKEHPATKTMMWMFDEASGFWDKTYDGVPTIW